MRTRGELEIAIRDGVSRFELDYFGRGPQHIHAHLIGDLLVIRLQGVLTSAEQHLVKSLPAGRSSGFVCAGLRDTQPAPRASWSTSLSLAATLRWLASKSTKAIFREFKSASKQLYLQVW